MERAKLAVSEELKEKAAKMPPAPPPKPKKELSAPTFFSTGSTLLDLVIGGGWAHGRVFNIVGDKSTGKTLLAVEAFANFHRAFPNGKMRYAEAEAAFDEVFAEQLGFPEEVERPDELLHTIEDFQADFYSFIDRCVKAKVPGIYIEDSLDALTSEGEVEKFEKSMEKRLAGKADDGAGSYGTAKAKGMGELFKQLVKDAAKANVSLGIISQIRDKIGVTFGETKMRSGGHALDFYASQVVWLADLGKISATALGIERNIGVEILAKCKKLKVGMPYREAAMTILFGYGVDNHMSMLEWLKGEADAFPKPKAGEEDRYKAVKKAINDARDIQDYATLNKIEAELKADVIRIWKEVDKRLAPTVRKYQPIGESK